MRDLCNAVLPNTQVGLLQNSAAYLGLEPEVKAHGHQNSLRANEICTQKRLLLRALTMESHLTWGIAVPFHFNSRREGLLEAF